MAHLIEEVQPHGVAYRRGIRAGDNLVAINGEPILDEIDYQALIWKFFQQVGEVWCRELRKIKANYA